MPQTEQPRYVKMPDGTYIEWPANVSAEDFKAKVSGKFGNTQTDTRNSFQKAIDTAAETEPFSTDKGVVGNLKTALNDLGAGAVRTIASPFAHPIQTAEGLGKLALGPLAPLVPTYRREMETPSDMAKKSNETWGQYGGRLGGEAVAALPGLGLAAAMGTPARGFATEAEDAQALRALGIKSAANDEGLPTLSNIKGARPFLKGAKNLADLQSKIAPAKGEIWAPYENAVNRIGGNRVMGPDGMTTIRALEDERLQLSALNRRLKTGDPEALQLAQQKGLTQAQLLEREDAVKSALDPELTKAGIKPQDIRKAFGQVAQVEHDVQGRTTLVEQPQRYGLGKVADIDIAKPGNIVPQIGAGIKDIWQGKPWWSGKPTDVAVREGFRFGGEKPNFISSFKAPQLMRGAYQPTAVPNYPRLTSTAGPGEAQPMLGYPHPYIEPGEAGTIRPMPPENRLALPSETAASGTQPYIAYRFIPRGASGESTRMAAPQFIRPGKMPAIGGTISPHLPEGAEGPTIGLRPGVRGLLPGRQEEIAPPPVTTNPIFPPGSAYRGIEESQFYPPASAFRMRNVPQMWTEEELKNLK